MTRTIAITTPAIAPAERPPLDRAPLCAPTAVLPWLEVDVLEGGMADAEGRGGVKVVVGSELESATSVDDVDDAEDDDWAIVEEVEVEVVSSVVVTVVVDVGEAVS